MPADLTAPQLIALLREHPGACGMLHIDVAIVFNRDVVRFRDLTLVSDATPENSDHFAMGICAITGAAVEKCDELGIEIAPDADGFGTMDRKCMLTCLGVTSARMVIGNKHPTRLHAALAALEQHAKEKSSG